jgi:hypothetical protein
MQKIRRIEEIENIGFVSTRIASKDSICLEIGKWT